MDILVLRSAQVVEAGVYLGLLEWVAFSVNERMSVLMLFGENVLNVGHVFAPALSQGFDSARVCRVAAVRVGPQGKLLSAVGANGACYPNVNHYVIGQEASGPMSVESEGASAGGWGEVTPMCTQVCAAGTVDPSRHRDAR